jgi:quercetin dioxygenase-like cupin family protein
MATTGRSGRYRRPTVAIEQITERNDLVIRRMILEPGEHMHWHTDTCHRFTVVVSGDRLAIEYRGDAERHEFAVRPGQADWDPPDDRVHRAVNIGTTRYEEVVTFFRSGAGVDPQPDSGAGSP